MPPGPGSRSSLGQFFSRPPPLNVLASGPGGGVALTERSANEDAAPASAGADRRRQGAESRSARARQKGRPQRPTSTSTPLRLRVRWVSWRAARSRSAFSQCCRRGRRAAPSPGNAGVAFFRARLPRFSAHDLPRPEPDKGSGCGLISGFVKYLHAYIKA